jgi:hypothetical protein
MPSTYRIYLEVGDRRVFAGALDWPGWCRSARDEESAVETLIVYGPRYAKALGRAGQGFKAPTDPSSVRIVERLRGSASTDFGVPGTAPKADRRPLDDAELKRESAFLRACWRKFDRTARAAAGAVLSKGPRGGGRDLDVIISHVLEADRAYLSRLGGTSGDSGGKAGAAQMSGLRKAIVETVSGRAHGAPPAKKRRSAALWTPRYAVRRSAWHALDHAWEIEDRASSGKHAKGR